MPHSHRYSFLSPLLMYISIISSAQILFVLVCCPTSIFTTQSTFILNVLCPISLLLHTADLLPLSFMVFSSPDSFFESLPNTYDLRSPSLSHSSPLHTTHGLPLSVFLCTCTSSFDLFIFLPCRSSSALIHLTFCQEFHIFLPFPYLFRSQIPPLPLLVSLPPFVIGSLAFTMSSFPSRALSPTINEFILHSTLISFSTRPTFSMHSFFSPPIYTSPWICYLLGTHGFTNSHVFPFLLTLFPH